MYGENTHMTATKQAFAIIIIQNDLVQINISELTVIKCCCFYSTMFHHLRQWNPFTEEDYELWKYQTTKSRMSLFVLFVHFYIWRALLKS